MVIFLLLITLLVPKLAQANEFVSLGATYNTNGYVGAKLGDFSFFTADMQTEGLSHYGYGGAGLEFGNGFAANLDASSGVILYQMSPSTFSAIFGFDTTGTINLNTDSAVHSFYQWIPAMTIGPQLKFNWGRIILVGKEGVAMSDYDTLNVLPDFHFSQGVGLYVDSNHVCFGIDYTVFGDNQMAGVDLVLSLSKTFKFDIKVDQEQNIPMGLRDQQGSIMWKSDLW